MRKLLRSSSQWVFRGLGLGLVLLAFAGMAMARQPVVPEIDPGSATSALALLAGGVILLKDRFRTR